MVISKNYKISSEIKFEIENVDFVRQKLWAKNFESKILSEFKLKNKVGNRKCWFCASKIMSGKFWGVSYSKWALDLRAKSGV